MERQNDKRLPTPEGASSARLRAVLASSLDPLVTIDMRGTIVSVSASVQRVFGYEPEELVGRNVTGLMPAAFREDHERGLERYRSSGVSELVGATRELEVLCKDGSVIICELSFSRADIPGEPEPLITGSFRDITRRKRAEREVVAYQEQLRALAAELMSTEERMRRRLAVELHDSISQVVALAKMRLSTLRNSSPGLDQESLRDLERLLDQAQDATRALTFELSPSILYDLGLNPALEWLAEDMLGRYGLRVTIEGKVAVQALDEQISVTLFRAVRELLINVAKHAGVEHSYVRVRQDEGGLRVMVVDKGSGFDASEPDPVHFGLFGNRERFSHIGGNLEICSSPKQGTTVTIWVPSGQAD